MKRFSLVRWVAAVIAVVGMVGAVAPAVAEAEDFLIGNGKFEITSAPGPLRSGVIKGKSAPGGHFTGVFELEFSNEGQHIDGTICYLYDEGMLVLDYTVDYDAEVDAFVGTFEVVGGEGIFWDATGGGDAMVDRGSKGHFSAVGLISY